jgi:hypothetical protein
MEVFEHGPAEAIVVEVGKTWTTISHLYTSRDKETNRYYTPMINLYVIFRELQAKYDKKLADETVNYIKAKMDAL